MSFITDKQTLEDLNLLGKYRPHSILSLFNQTKTLGGSRLLESMFNDPLSDPDAINERVRIFQYFQLQRLTFPFNEEQLTRVENFLSGDPYGPLTVITRKLQHNFLRDERYQQLIDGLKATVEFIQQLQEWAPNIDKTQYKPIEQLATIIAGIPIHSELTATNLVRYNRLLKRKRRNEMETLLGIVYELDCYIAVANLAAGKGLSYAKAHPKQTHFIKTAALWHPAVEKAVANPIQLDTNQNMLFLTGANMAGKSTFMKSVGIAVYLAHMGFPVAAKQMEFSIRDGLYTSINVGDNLAQGYSHFYAEVLRVKHVAQEVSAGKNLLIIFDELFKGTNVKDAFDATLAVTQLLAEYRRNLYIVSTHIIEVGETLGETSSNVQFAYLPTVMEGRIPRYPYTMKQGITSDKHGMMIIENEGIIEILKHKK